MDWSSWLSSSGLGPSLAYDYSLLFSNNELNEDDIPYLDHEFLKSMGISVAKHRLEILKLAKKHQKEKKTEPVAGLLTAVKKTKKCLSKYFNSFAQRESSAIVVMPRSSSYSYRWKGSMLKRNRGVVILKQGRLMITEGSSVKTSEPSLIDQGHYESSKCGSEAREIKWDSMFEDLKPT